MGDARTLSADRSGWNVVAAVGAPAGDDGAGAAAARWRGRADDSHERAAVGGPRAGAVGAAAAVAGAGAGAVHAGPAVAGAGAGAGRFRRRRRAAPVAGAVAGRAAAVDSAGARAPSRHRRRPSAADHPAGGDDRQRRRRRLVPQVRRARKVSAPFRDAIVLTRPCSLGVLALPRPTAASLARSAEGAARRAAAEQALRASAAGSLRAAPARPVAVRRASIAPRASLAPTRAATTAAPTKRTNDEVDGMEVRPRLGGARRTSPSLWITFDSVSCMQAVRFPDAGGL